MRTDVKVGLVCVFAVVLAVVCYFTLHDKNRAVISTTGATPAAVVADTSGAGTGTLNIAPAPTTAPSAAANDLSTTPSLAATTGGSLLGPTSAYGQVSPPTNNLGGTVISPPGASTQAGTTGGSMSLTPPGGASMTTPLIPSPGLTAPGTPGTPGLSTAPLVPSPAFSSPTDNNLSTIPAMPKHSKNGKSKLHSATPESTPGSTLDLTAPTGGSTVDLSGGTGSGTGSSYAIRQGDTLAALAKRNGVTVKEILAANPGVNPNRLKVGQKVNIPAAGEAPTTRSATASRTATTRSSASRKKATAGHPAATAGGTYTIKKGDTLRKIAKTVYGDENMWQRIFRANRGDLASPNDITAGEVIKLPSTK